MLEKLQLYLTEHHAVWVAQALIWLWLFTLPIHDNLVAIVALVSIDFIVGIWAAKKRGEKITSYGFRRTITQKLLPFWVAILSAHVVEQDFMSGIPLVQVTAGFIAVSELKSVMERLSEITGLDFWTTIRERLQPAVKTGPEEKQKDA